MSLDPNLLVPNEKYIDSTQTKLTNLPSKNSDDSQLLPSTNENSDSPNEN